MGDGCWRGILSFFSLLFLRTYGFLLARCFRRLLIFLPSFLPSFLAELTLVIATEATYFRLLLELGVWDGSNVMFCPGCTLFSFQIRDASSSF